MLYSKHLFAHEVSEALARKEPLCEARRAGDGHTATRNTTLQMSAATYGSYSPFSDRCDRWERIATTHDAEGETERTQSADRKRNAETTHAKMPIRWVPLRVPHR